ncbi:Flp family type IVb pilin [Salirhabdus salicampi]|uniref:Flp family type IVb pilin n=1 Tax=Salirhabdus salicampi TaxID=476102 RepID=UPI003F5ACF36
MNKLKEFFIEEEGQGMTEYGLILGLIALAVVAVLILFGDTLRDRFQAIVDALTNAGNNTGTTQ